MSTRSPDLGRTPNPTLDFRKGEAHIRRFRVGGVVFVAEGRRVARCLGTSEIIE